jgi:hypothetical protein
VVLGGEGQGAADSRAGYGASEEEARGGSCRGRRSGRGQVEGGRPRARQDEGLPCVAGRGEFALSSLLAPLRSICGLLPASRLGVLRVRGGETVLRVSQTLVWRLRSRQLD